jgi:hypothetical protein
MFIAECPLVHVLDVSDASVASQYCALVSQRSEPIDYSPLPFPPLFDR